MANPKKRLPQNVDGEWFVDSTCIDCDACRQLAPEIFEEGDAYSFVFHQPKTVEQLRAASRALLACPTGSIGTIHTNSAKEAFDDFPLLLEGDVYYCGFHSPASYGGSSYFIRNKDGNWLVDSPKYLPQLVKNFERYGGIKYIFLTHRDDVADAHRYARRFGSIRIIHREELLAQPGAEAVLNGTDPIPLFPDFLVIPTPGHTRGHCVLLYKNTFLFTGDHLWWNRSKERLSASQDYCWYDWPLQISSLQKLLNYRFLWVLPGHGQRGHFDVETMHAKLSELVTLLKKHGLHEE